MMMMLKGMEEKRREENETDQKQQHQTHKTMKPVPRKEKKPPSKIQIMPKIRKPHTPYPHIPTSQPKSNRTEATPFPALIPPIPQAVELERTSEGDSRIGKTPLLCIPPDVAENSLLNRVEIRYLSWSDAFGWGL